MTALRAFRSRHPKALNVHLQEAGASYSLCNTRRPWASGDIGPTSRICPRCAAEARKRGLDYDEKEVLGQ